MIISCFGPTPKVKKGRKKTKPAEETSKPKKRSHGFEAASTMDTYPEICAYMLRDGTWQPSQHYKAHRSTVENLPPRAEWAMHQETLKSTHDDVKKTHENIEKLHDSVSYLKGAWSDHTRKQDDCLAEIEKVHKQLEAEAKKNDEREGMRYWRQRLVETYAEGKKHGEEETASRAHREWEEEQLRAIREEWEAEKQEMLKQRQQHKTQQTAERHLNELRALREDLKMERQEALKRYQLEARQKLEEEALDRAMQRQRRLAEEERDSRAAADEERIRGLADRIRQDRYYYYGGSDRETQTTSDRGRFPDETPEPSRRYRRAANGGAYPAPDEEDLPWVEETVEEEFPIYHSIGRRERRRTTLRGTGRRPRRSRGY